jgi:hypothetical protein
MPRILDDKAQIGFPSEIDRSPYLRNVGNLHRVFRVAAERTYLGRAIICRHASSALKNRPHVRRGMGMVIERICEVVGNVRALCFVFLAHCVL